MSMHAPEALRVLLVEDAEDDAFFIGRALGSINHLRVAFWARDGQEAIAYLVGVGGFGDRDQFPFPDLVILDLMMPHLNGFQVLHWLMENPPKPKVLVFSRFEDMPNIQQAFTLGADAFHAKTYDAIAIEKTLKSLGWL